MDVKNTTWTPKVHFIIVTLAAVLLASLKANAYTGAYRWRRETGCDGGPGTTTNIAEIFQGRCHEHLQCLQTDQCNGCRLTPPNCTAIWEEFKKAFAFKEPCNITSPDAYDQVLKMAMPITPAGQTLFWSGLLDAALNVARVSMQYRILEESLPGYMANNLRWCGDPNSADGINYNNCPGYRGCANETIYTFWQAASAEFARQATGKVSVALNAHRKGGAFQNTSVFAMVELPNLNRDTVSEVEILLVPDIKSPNASETCSTGSLLEMQRRLDEAGLKWTCEYDPLEFRYIQCTTLEDPLQYEACRGESSLANLETIIVGAVLGGLILLLIILIIVLIVQSRKR